MSDTQDWKRVKIAEYRGWTNINPDGVAHSLANYSYRAMTGNKGTSSGIVPDYFNDLDACREMEQGLGNDMDTWLRYDKYLAEGGTLFNWHATAAQRAEAFGLTLGLWTPDQITP